MMDEANSMGRTMNMYFFSYHIKDDHGLEPDQICCQLLFTDNTSNERGQLYTPPLQAYHNHARQGQLEKLTPLVQTLEAPPTPCQLMEVTNPYVGDD